MKKEKKLVNLIFPISGALTALPFIYGELWILAWFTLAPMIYYLMSNAQEIGIRRAYGLGFAFGAGYYSVMYHWFISFYPMDFAGLDKLGSIGVIALCWLGLTLMHSLELGAVTMVYRLIKPDKNRPYLCITVFVCAWSTLEWTQTLGWRGLPWGRIALTQWKALPFIQSASLFGSIFVSAIIVAVNALIAATVREYLQRAESHLSADTPNTPNTPDIRCANSPVSPANTEESREPALSAATDTRLGKAFLYLRARIKKIISAFSASRAMRVYALTAAGIFILNLIFGVIRIAVYNETEGEPVTAAVIQGNISSIDKWANNSASNAAKVHLELTYKCVEETGADIVLWAETAIPVALDRYPNIKSKISAAAKELGIVLIVGAFDIRYNADTKENEEYNALIAFLPDGSELDTQYYKRHLVPFGESLPMEGFIRAFLPILLDLNLISEPLAQGTEPNVFKTEMGNIGGIICFDSIFHALPLDSVRDGAQLIAVSTNDSWFSDSSAVYQHNRQSAYRAIETGRYVIRSANTGISSIITPEGKLLAATEPLTEGYTAETVYLRSDRTLFSYVGDLFSYLCLCFTALSLAYSFYSAVISPKRKAK